MLPDIYKCHPKWKQVLKILQNGGSIYVVLAWYFKLCFAPLIENPAGSSTAPSVFL